MRTMTMAALAALAPCAAMADGVPAGSCSSSDAQPFVSCPTNLAKGHDYTFHAFEADGRTRLRLFDPHGGTVVDIVAPSDGNDDVEFRAAFTGAYRIQLDGDPERPAGGAGVELFTDCRRDAATACVLKPGGTGDGATTGTYDADAWRMRLAGGRASTLLFDAGYGTLSCDDGERRVNHLGTMTLSPRQATSCLFVISRALGPYHLSLR